MRKIFYILFLLPVILSSCEIYPDAFFFTDRVQAYIGEDVYFTNESYNAIDFEWDFGDGYISNAVNPVHSYSASGTYEVILTAYSRTGSIDRAYQTITVVSNTILEIEVLEWYDEYPVPGANVRLYPTLNDWDNETNMVAEGNTNSNGKVIFYDLGPYVYYVDVWEEHHNNFDLRGYMNDAYIRINQLIPNEVNTYIAYVDYVDKKGGTERDRSLVIKKLERKPKN
ncbi:MAG: PKD domain-containing protein [Bacteroidales bacterium]|nr:PKD domain-containing protein [Bacteroidales bacterium]